jgi:hypothetical protein
MMQPRYGFNSSGIIDGLCNFFERQSSAG